MHNVLITTGTLVMATTAELSHKALTVLPFHFLPHNAAAITMGTISFTAMWAVAMGPAHFNWNHSGPEKLKAPQPHEPDASDVSVTCGSALLIAISRDIPFHDEL